MSEKGKVWKIIIAVLIILTLISAIYFTFFFYYKPEDINHFKSKQTRCIKAVFINDLKTTTWSYKVKGKQAGNCIIEVGILQVKEGSMDRKRLEGKFMDCYLKLTSIAAPESDLTLCHGRLKEDIQEIMIKNTHSEILSNIEGELKGVL